MNFILYCLPAGEYELDSVTSDGRFMAGKFHDYLEMEKKKIVLNANEITYIGFYKINVKRNFLQHIDSFDCLTEDYFDYLEKQIKESEAASIKNLKCNKSLLELKWEK